MVEANQLISPANYLAHAGNVERVQHYASVDARKCLEPGVAGERYKPVCSVDRVEHTLSGLLHAADIQYHLLQLRIA